MKFKVQFVTQSEDGEDIVTDILDFTRENISVQPLV